MGEPTSLLGGTMVAGNVLEITTINGNTVILVRGGIGKNGHPGEVGIGHIIVGRKSEEIEARAKMTVLVQPHALDLVARDVEGQPNVYQLFPMS